MQGKHQWQMSGSELAKLVRDRSIVAQHCGCDRPCKRGDCYGPWCLVDTGLDELIASRFRSLDEAKLELVRALGLPCSR